MIIRSCRSRLALFAICSGVVGENGTTLRQLGRVENLSLNGIGMFVNDALPVGTTITMTYGEGELTATVRHCTAVGNRRQQCRR